MENVTRYRKYIKLKGAFEGFLTYQSEKSMNFFRPATPQEYSLQQLAQTLYNNATDYYSPEHTHEWIYSLSLPSKRCINSIKGIRILIIQFILYIPAEETAAIHMLKLLFTNHSTESSATSSVITHRVRKN